MRFKIWKKWIFLVCTVGLIIQTAIEIKNFCVQVLINGHSQAWCFVGNILNFMEKPKETPFD